MDPATAPDAEPAETLDLTPRLDAGDERLRAAAVRAGVGGAHALLEVCRHVMTDRRYADSTRAVFAEILEHVRAGLGQGGIRRG